jgi:hypothetical protein
VVLVLLVFGVLVRGLVLALVSVHWLVRVLGLVLVLALALVRCLCWCLVWSRC